jgi:RNA polymerase sigma factor (sigma-70 family)
MTDVELLQQHREGTESAFADLIRRHLDWVYGLARRRLRDPHLADDVCQAVFVLLHRKGPQFTSDRALIAWLHKTAWYASQTAARSERRRHHHETEAAMQQSRSNKTPDPNDAWQELAPLLDELIGRLNVVDRQAVLLRYYRDLTFAQVAAEIGTTEDAARKRVDRAIDKLRQIAAGKRIEVTTACLTGGLLKVRVPPPPGLAAITTVAATSAAGSTLAASSGLLVKGALAMMTSTKITLVCAAAVALLVLFTATFLGTIWLTSPPVRVVVSTPPTSPPDSARQTVPVDGALTQNPGANLTAWGRIQGRLMIGSKPGANIELQAYPIDPSQTQRLVRARTDAFGNFVIARVPPGMIRIDRSFVERAGADTFFYSVELATIQIDVGQTVRVKFGGVGRPVTGRFVFPPGMNPSEYFINARAIPLQSAGQYFLQVDPQRNFRIDDVPPGDYRIHIFVQPVRGGRTALRLEPTFTMPDVPGGVSDVPLAIPDMSLLDGRSAGGDLPPTSEPVDHVTAINSFPRVSPFTGARWIGTTYQVRVNATWYELVALNNLPIGQIISFAQRTYGDRWQKRIDEDLPTVLAAMGRPVDPSMTAKLQLRALDTGNTVTLDAVPMTEANRRLVWSQRNPAIKVPSDHPFTAVRWQPNSLIPSVQVNGSWYDLIGINDQSLLNIVDYAQKSYGPSWRSRIESNVSQVLADMGQPARSTMTLDLAAANAPPAR